MKAKNNGRKGLKGKTKGSISNIINMDEVTKFDSWILQKHEWLVSLKESKIKLSCFKNSLTKIYPDIRKIFS